MRLIVYLSSIKTQTTSTRVSSNNFSVFKNPGAIDGRKGLKSKIINSSGVTETSKGLGNNRLEFNKR